MPYIGKERRKAIEQGEPPQTIGELNYVITQEVLFYLKQKGISYNSINEIIGVLDCCKMEFYRRVGVPYEDKKIKDNGDVFV